MKLDEYFEILEQLPLEKSELCMFGKLCRSFLERDAVFTRYLASEFECAIQKPSLQEKIITIYRDDLENQKQRIIQEITCRLPYKNTLDFYAPQLLRIVQKLKIHTYSDLVRDIEKENEEFPGNIEILTNKYKIIHGSIDVDYIKNNYITYYMCSILYNSYKFKKSRVDLLNFKYADVLASEYNKIEIDIASIDQQFSKYKLLTLNQNIKIYNDKDSQTLKDSRINKYLWISVPRKLLLSIEDLISSASIKEIAFRIDYISDSVPVMEEMEFGSKLSISLEKLPEISKFYSKENYENKLWIHHDATKSSLTFEELLEDFEIVHDSIVHIEYKKAKNEQYMISHLDHEYIIYSQDEYFEKLENPRKKGSRKVKTFKIDNSTIPFHGKINGDYFLFQVLDAYFRNKDLINEYFANV